MKTNHQRGFKDTRGPRMVYRKYYVGGGEAVKLPLSDKCIAANAPTCGDHNCGKHGIARDRRGAKKFVNSRTRFHENAALKKIVEHSYEQD